MDTRIELKSKASGAQAWLEVTYQGLHPPVALFDDLAMVGWKTPAIPPPPASAIDWSRPDPETGQRFTLSGYVVEAAKVEPPPGTGALGRWTAADRRAHLGVLEGILRRHGLDGSPLVHTPARAGLPSRTRAVPASTAATSTVPSTGQPTPLPTGMVRVMAPIVPIAEAAMATALANVGVRGFTFTEVHRVITYRFRGSDAEQRVVDHVRLEVMVLAESVEVVRDAMIRVAEDLGLAPPDILVEGAEDTTERGASGAEGRSAGRPARPLLASA
jgi:nitrogen regulatory protein PII